MVEIKVTGATPLEVLASLTAFGMHCMSNAMVLAAAERVLAEEKDKLPTPTVQEAKEKEELKASPQEAKAEPKPDPTPGPATTDPGPTAAPTDTAKPTPTIEQVREKGIAFVRKHNREALVAILKEFNATGISALAEQDRAPFLARLESLGEKDA